MVSIHVCGQELGAVRRRGCFDLLPGFVVFPFSFLYTYLTPSLGNVCVWVWVGVGVCVCVFVLRPLRPLLAFLAFYKSTNPFRLAWAGALT